MEGMEGLTGKRILVTGGTGFVGSHVVAALLTKHARVIVPFRSLDPRSYFSLQRLDRAVTMVMGDIKDYQRVFEIVTKYEIDYIFHLGALATVDTAYANPIETIATNVLGTVHILEAARRSGRVRGVVVASSDKAYGKSAKIYKETDALAGDHPYEVSKSAADLIATSYHKTYGLPVVITRFGNIYGPGDNNFSRIIPGIMQSVLTGERLVIRSDGSYVRDYVYVGDVASAYLFILAHFDTMKGEAYNLSSRDSLSVLEVVKYAQRVLKKNIPYTIADVAKNEIPYQHLDWSKIQRLGWNPKTRLGTGIKETYQWYKRHWK